MSLPGPTRGYAVLRRSIEWLEASNWRFEVAEHFWPEDSMMGFNNSCKQNYPSHTQLENDVEGL